MNRTSATKGGFTLTEILVVVAIIGALAAIAIPNFVKARRDSQKSACIVNLRMVDNAVSEWALDNKKPANSPVTKADILPYLQGNKMPTCTANATIELQVTTTSASPTCSTAGHTL